MLRTCHPDRIFSFWCAQGSGWGLAPHLPSSPAFSQCHVSHPLPFGACRLRVRTVSWRVCTESLAARLTPFLRCARKIDNQRRLRGPHHHHRLQGIIIIQLYFHREGLHPLGAGPSPRWREVNTLRNPEVSTRPPTTTRPNG